MTRPGKIKLTPMAIAILELLHERPMHPYEMRQLMRERGVALRVKLSAGALYHTVDKLTEAEVIEVVDTQREGNRPERTVYAISGAGRDLYASRTLEMLAEPAEEYPQYPLALGSISDLSKKEVISALNTRVAHLETKLATAKVIQERLLDEKVAPMYVIDYDYLATMWRAEYEWTKKLLSDMETERLEWPKKNEGNNHAH